MGFQNQCITHRMQIQFFCQGYVSYWLQNFFGNTKTHLSDRYFLKKSIFREKSPNHLQIFKQTWKQFLSKNLGDFGLFFTKNRFLSKVSIFTQKRNKGVTEMCFCLLKIPKKFWGQYDTYSWQKNWICIRCVIHWF